MAQPTKSAQPTVGAPSVQATQNAQPSVAQGQPTVPAPTSPAAAQQPPIRMLKRNEMDQIFVALARIVLGSGDASVAYDEDHTQTPAPGRISSRKRAQ